MTEAATMPDDICDDCRADQHANCIGTFVNDDEVTTLCVCEECETETCERCMGVGMIEKTIGIQWLEVDCPDCGGTGQVGTR